MNNGEGFALGIIVAALVYLLFKREFESKRHHHGAAPNGVSPRGDFGTGGGCGCNGGAKAPGASSGTSPVSIGGNSYQTGSGAFPSSPIVGTNHGK